MKHRIFLVLALTSMTALARDPVESVESDPMGGGNPVENKTSTSTPVKKIPTADPMGGATTPLQKQLRIKLRKPSQNLPHPPNQ